MIAVDTNILVYAHRRDSAWFDVARRRLQELAEGPASWAIPWPCIHEFLGIVTHTRIYAPPTPLNAAVDQVDAWLASPSVSVLSEAEGYWEELRGTVQTARVFGPKIHDARIAALCIQHGVAELWTADRDFGHFPRLNIRNPLVE
jgi:toxin-antitoxin system PIN domain toxin